MPDKPPPRRSPLSPKDCNLARAFALIGDRWSLMILRSALFGLGAPMTSPPNLARRAPFSPIG